MTEINFKWSLDAELNGVKYTLNSYTRANDTKEILLTVSDDNDTKVFFFTLEEAKLVGEMLSIAAEQCAEDYE